MVSSKVVRYIGLVIGGLAISVSVASSAFAGGPVRFTSTELDAALLLLKPERSQIGVDGRMAHFVPAPSLRFLGLQSVDQKLDLSFILDLVDLRFDHLNAQVPVIAFGEGALTLTLPIEDNPRALRSLLGSIGFSGVSLVARIVWSNADGAHPVLAIDSVRLDGKISGKGILGSKLILRKLTDFAVTHFRDAIVSLLAEPTVSEGIETGLLKYAQFAEGQEAQGIVPGTLKFYSDGEVTGISYETIP